MLRPRFFIEVFLAAVFLTGCTVGSFFKSRECTDIASPAVNAFSTATPQGSSWLYQLQTADPDQIAAADYDIIVIDYSRDGTEDQKYTTLETDLMRSRGTTRDIIAYMSIGEAEDYRYYFEPSWIAALGNQPGDDAPCWLGRTNPDWKGNYKVQYWSESWQITILDYLDRIIDAGFDGVYLDIIDGYEYWADSDNQEGFSIGEDLAVSRMIDLVKRIAYHARVTKGKPDFLVIPQNGEGILEYDTGDYLKTISGIGIEDLFYDETNPVDPEETLNRISWIDRISDAGKKVLVVDYVDDGSTGQANVDRIADFLARSREKGYYPYAGLSDRALDTMNSF